jgi:hypothetical protein
MAGDDGVPGIGDGRAVLRDRAGAGGGTRTGARPAPLTRC